MLSVGRIAIRHCQRIDVGCFANQPSRLKALQQWPQSQQPRCIYTLCRKAVAAAPSSVQPYLELIRFDKPIGSLLLFWPSGWSLCLAAPPGALPDAGMLAVFATGCVVMRSAGCTVNDMWDRNFDGRVLRTKDRPIASGRISLTEAGVFLTGQIGVALFILSQLNEYTILLGLSSLSLVVTYPAMKRFTFWPQVYLGLAMNFGTLLGYSAVHGYCDWTVCLPLYLAGISWTIVYDTIYAHQDKDDDIHIGVKSTALRFGENTKPWLAGFSAVTVASLGVVGSVCQLGWPYYATVAGVAAHLAHQVATLRMDDREDCQEKFVSNSNLGAILFLGILFGNLAREADRNEIE